MKRTRCLHKAVPVPPLKRSPPRLAQGPPDRARPQDAARSKPESRNGTPNTHQASKPRYPASLDAALSRPSKMSTFRKGLLFMSIFTGAGFVAYGASLIISYRRLIASYVKSGGSSEDLESQTDLSARFDEIAQSYDDEVGFTEWITGIKNRRKKLIQRARGNVLEVSVGTGRNTTFYAEELDRQRQQALKQKSSSGMWQSAGNVVGVGSSSSQDAPEEDEGIKSLTFVDKSVQMIEVARNKWVREEMHREAIAKKRGMWTTIPGKRGSQLMMDEENLKWIVGDAEKATDIPGTSARAGGGRELEGFHTGVAQSYSGSTRTQSSESSTSSIQQVKAFLGFGNAPTRQQTTTVAVSSPADTPKTYDTIIQTFGLCSTPNPVSLLNNLGRLCKQTSMTSNLQSFGDESDEKDNAPAGGQILLLEHGRSHYNWMNTLLDASAQQHADKYGCWYNRDIGKIVENSELEVVSIRRFHLGTTWEVVLRPKSSD